MKNGIMLTPWLEWALAGGDERRHRAGLGDPFLQDLPVVRLAVVEHGVGIDRLVELADVRVDAELAEEGLHAEGAGLVGHDRHDVAADVLVAHQPDQQPHEGHRGRDLAALAAGEELGEVLPLRRLQLHRGRAPAGHEPAQRLAPLAQVVHLRAVVRRLVELGPAGGRVGNRNLEAAAELDQLLLVELLLLVGDVAAFAGLAQAVALDRLGQDDRRRALGARRPPCRPRRPSPGRARRDSAAESARRSGRPPSPPAADRRRRSARGCSRPS